MQIEHVFDILTGTAHISLKHQSDIFGEFFLQSSEQVYFLVDTL